MKARFRRRLGAELVVSPEGAIKQCATVRVQWWWRVHLSAACLAQTANTAQQEIDSTLMSLCGAAPEICDLFAVQTTSYATRKQKATTNKNRTAAVRLYICWCLK